MIERIKMISEPIDQARRTAARIAGISCVFAMVIVVFGNYALLNPLMVPGNAAETARNITAHETQVRVALTCFLLYSLVSVILLSAFYVILRPVNMLLALLGSVSRLVFAMLWLLSTLNLLNALRLLGHGRYLQVFEADRLQALARLSIASNFDDYYVGLPFFGLAVTIWSYLWLKSKYVPVSLSWFGLISAAWCVICAFVYLLFPNFGKTVNPYWFDSAMGIYELALGLWLLVRGITPRAPVAE
jgi:hypothetical protein